MAFKSFFLEVSSPDGDIFICAPEGLSEDAVLAGFCSVLFYENMENSTIPLR